MLYLIRRAQIQPQGLHALSSSSSSSDPDAAPPCPLVITDIAKDAGVDKGQLIDIAKDLSSKNPIFLDELSKMLEESKLAQVDLDGLVQDVGLASSIRTVQKLIGYEFKHPNETIVIALSKPPSSTDFEYLARTGFLAAYLVVGIRLDKEVNVSQIRSHNLCDANLEKLSKTYNLPSLLHRPPSSLLPSSKPKAIADILKAILGAVFKDSVFDLDLFTQVVLSLIPLELEVENVVTPSILIKKALEDAGIEAFDVKPHVENGVTTYEVYAATYGEIIGTGFSKEEAMLQGLKYIMEYK